jgi:hypothetical protein
MGADKPHVPINRVPFGPLPSEPTTPVMPSCRPPHVALLVLYETMLADCAHSHTPTHHRTHAMRSRRTGDERPPCW